MVAALRDGNIDRSHGKVSLDCTGAHSKEETPFPAINVDEWKRENRGLYIDRKSRASAERTGSAYHVAGVPLSRRRVTWSHVFDPEHTGKLFG
jgi:hypothetical protein